MGSSFSISKFKSDKKFYNQYQYGVSFCFPNVRALRPSIQCKKDDEQWMFSSITSSLEYLDQRKNYGGRWTSTYSNILERNKARDQLFRIAKFYKSRPGLIKITISSNFATVYTNNKQDIADLIDLLPVDSYVYVREAIVDRPLNTIKRENYPFKYRTYLRDLLLDSAEKERLVNYLHGQNHVKLSPSLNKWIEPANKLKIYNFIQRHYFIDHTSLSDKLMLEIILPGSTRKTIEILDK